MDTLTIRALETSFAWRDVKRARERRELVRAIDATFGAVAVVLDESAHRFARAPLRIARRIFPRRVHADVPPAYAIFGDKIFFTCRFAPYDARTKRGFGPLCRAAMVLHEAVHIIDARSGEPEIHVSEWDEPRFSRLRPEQAVHNPSAYASFAAQVHARAIAWPPEARFGAGNASM
jgi:hypothetical protein